MSALTKNERDGLDDVFLSIHANQVKYQRIKDISTLIMSQNKDIYFSKLRRQAKYGLNKSKLSKFFLSLAKKKKNLSK